MQSVHRFFLFSSMIGLLIIISGCKKFLDQKSRQSLTNISSLRDMQALLDDHSVVSTDEPTVAEISSDDYYLTWLEWNPRAEFDKEKHVWGENIFPNLDNDWFNIYRRVYRANLVLDNIDGVDHSTPLTDSLWRNIKGQALFLRGRSFLSAALIWSLAYDPATSNTDMGIPLRLNSVFSEPSVRGTVEQTYQQIISDLTESIQLLPLKPIHVFRASKPAAQAMLARTYLAMRRYNDCLVYADACLQTNQILIDYKSALDTNMSSTSTSAFTFGPPESQYAAVDKEIIFACRMQAPAILSNQRARTDTFLYRSYIPTDLRKKLFFRTIAVPGMPNGYGFRGSFNGSSAQFCGIAVDEVYLMRAECYARVNNVPKAMADLNTLMRKRSNNGFVDLAASTKEEALQKVLSERRKELIFRSLRWMDIKRLNKEGANILLKRTLDSSGVVIREAELLPNSPRYALPLPADVIALSGMQQNPR